MPGVSLVLPKPLVHSCFRGDYLLCNFSMGQLVEVKIIIKFDDQHSIRLMVFLGVLKEK